MSARSGREQPSPLPAAEHEEFVAEVLRQIDFWRRAEVSPDRGYPGIRQSGPNKVDIAFELMLGGVARSLD